MKELLILSGKGGTGKTTIASAFIELGNIKSYADCDVDAPNLGLLFDKGELVKRRDYKGMDKALIDQDMCSQCGLCKEKCAFSAIKHLEESDTFLIDGYACEGCSVCERICPEGAITMVDNIAGELELHKNDKIFSTAKLKIGQGNSGLLVTEVKDQLRENTKYRDIDISIIDGSPGIGCPVIASVNDVDMILIVTEPTVSGLSDMKRIVETAKSFDKELLICVNKYDVNEKIAEEIEEYAEGEGIELVGKIPYDKEIVNLLNQGRPASQGDSSGVEAIRRIYDRTMNILSKEREDIL